MPNRRERRKLLRKQGRPPVPSTPDIPPQNEPAPQPEKRVSKQILAWVVVGAVILLLLGVGFTFMTASLLYHVWIADACFFLSAALFVGKFWTWEDTHKEPSNSRRKLISIAVISAIATLAAIVFANHYLNKPDRKQLANVDWLAPKPNQQATTPPLPTRSPKFRAVMGGISVAPLLEKGKAGAVIGCLSYIANTGEPSTISDVEMTLALEGKIINGVLPTAPGADEKIVIAAAPGHLKYLVGKENWENLSLKPIGTNDTVHGWLLGRFYGVSQSDVLKNHGTLTVIFTDPSGNKVKASRTFTGINENLFSLPEIQGNPLSRTR